MITLASTVELPPVEEQKTVERNNPTVEKPEFNSQNDEDVIIIRHNSEGTLEITGNDANFTIIRHGEAGAPEILGDKPSDDFLIITHTLPEQVITEKEKILEVTKEASSIEITDHTNDKSNTQQNENYMFVIGNNDESQAFDDAVGNIEVQTVNFLITNQENVAVTEITTEQFLEKNNRESTEVILNTEKEQTTEKTPETNAEPVLQTTNETSEKVENEEVENQKEQKDKSSFWTYLKYSGYGIGIFFSPIVIIFLIALFFKGIVFRVLKYFDIIDPKDSQQGNNNKIELVTVNEITDRLFDKTIDRYKLLFNNQLTGFINSLLDILKNYCKKILDKISISVNIENTFNLYF